MKASQRDFARVAQTIGNRLRIAFFCGPDEAGAAAAAKRVVAQLPDAGERVDIEGAALKADPARLGDETRSNSLFGGSRHIWVRASGDDAHDAVQLLLELIDSARPTAPARSLSPPPTPPTNPVRPSLLPPVTIA